MAGLERSGTNSACSHRTGSKVERGRTGYFGLQLIPMPCPFRLQLSTPCLGNDTWGVDTAWGPQSFPPHPCRRSWGLCLPAPAGILAPLATVCSSSGLSSSTQFLPPSLVSSPVSFPIRLQGAVMSTADLSLPWLPTDKDRAQPDVPSPSQAGPCLNLVNNKTPSLSKTELGGL